MRLSLSSTEASSLSITVRESPNFVLTFKEPKNRFQGTNFARLCSLVGQYDNHISTRFLAPIDCLKIPALSLCASLHPPPPSQVAEFIDTWLVDKPWNRVVVQAHSNLACGPAQQPYAGVDFILQPMICEFVTALHVHLERPDLPLAVADRQRWKMLFSYASATVGYQNSLFYTVKKLFSKRLVYYICLEGPNLKIYDEIPWSICILTCSVRIKIQNTRGSLLECFTSIMVTD